MPPAPALIGPTASGKSALAVELARQLDAEIISVDSGAIYRGMDIGTATPDAAMQKQVAHHLVNIADPGDSYNVGRFYRDAAAAAAAARARGKTPLFAGGSMMYFNVLFNGLHKLPPVPRHIAERVQRQAAQHGVAALYRALQEMDKDAAAALAPTDTQRIIRAVCLCQSGAPPRAAARQKHPPLALAPLLLIPADRAFLRRRITERLQKMWADGLLEETRRLLADLPADAPALKMAGYRQAVRHLQGEYDEATMHSRAATATHQLAKRQLTWMQKWRGRSAVLDPFADDFTAARALAALAAPAAD